MRQGQSGKFPQNTKIFAAGEAIFQFEPMSTAKVNKFDLGFQVVGGVRCQEHGLHRLSRLGGQMAMKES